ncbi:MAG: ATPase central domain protein [Rickettsiales bacterium]|jgi:putative ATPase|nr:ATPase central domain protein [Rickettsiales bacterium]
MKMTPSLFSTNTPAPSPLADRLRPSTFEGVVGQEHLLGSEGLLTRLLASGHIPSVILWGPPGCGKTTIAKIMARTSGCHFDIVSAVSSGTADLKKLFEQAEFRQQQGIRTLLLVDEIHRFNRAQQDVFLPFIENGTIVLVGATTENPSFELNPALLSRCKVLVLHRLDEEALLHLIERVEESSGKKLPLTEEAKLALCAMADGDGRYFLGMCEELLALSTPEKLLDTAALAGIIQQRMPLYDKGQDSHYNLISALHKSLRGSDVDAGLYWLARMLEGGENPLYIIRRLVRFAVEDIGLADPEAVHQALAAKDTYDFLGSPEGELAIAQAVIYLATAPKSNAAYMAYKASRKDAKASGSHMPPKHILNAPTKMMKEQGYGQGYNYDHDTAEGFSGQDYFPESLGRRQYYQPPERGFEREIVKRLAYWDKLRKEKV